MDALLTGLLSPDAATRAAAEARYAEACATPATLAPALLAACSLPDEGKRALCAVLVRKLFDSGAASPIAALPPPALEAFKAGLLSAWAGEATPRLAKGLGHAVAAAAETLAGPGCAGWPALLPALFAAGRSPTPATRVACLAALQSLGERGGGALLSPHSNTLLPTLATFLGDTDLGVRCAALGATVAVLGCLDGDVPGGSSLVPTLLGVLEGALVADEDAAKTALQALCEMAGSQPGLVRPCAEGAARAMLAITGHDEFESETRGLGLEFLLVLAETSPATVRKMLPVVGRIIELSLGMLAEMEEDPEWVSADDDFTTFIDAGEDAEDGLAADAAAALDRLARAVGGKTVWPVFFPAAAARLASPKWQDRSAGLLGVALVVEGCRKLLAPQIHDIVKGIVGFLRDPHPRARYAAVRCVGQLILDFSDPSAAEGAEGVVGGDGAARLGAAASGGGGTSSKSRDTKVVKSIQEAAGALLLPALIEAASATNAAVPRIRGLAATALTNFCNGADGAWGWGGAEKRSLCRGYSDSPTPPPPPHTRRVV